MAKVVTGMVRFSFVKIFKAEGINGGDPRYSMCILIPKKDKKTIKAIENAVKDAYAEGLTGKWNGKKPSNWWNPLRDGDDEKADEHPEYADCMYINCKSARRPGIVDRDKMEILDPEEVYSGCYGRVSINFYPFDNSGNKGVGCGLNNVQKLKEGERLGGSASSPEDDFDDWVDDDDDF